MYQTLATVTRCCFVLDYAMKIIFTPVATKVTFQPAVHGVV